MQNGKKKKKKEKASLPLFFGFFFELRVCYEEVNPGTPHDLPPHNRLTRYATYQAPLAVVVEKYSLYILYIVSITTSMKIVKRRLDIFFL